jgi:GTP-binding protein
MSREADAFEAQARMAQMRIKLRREEMEKETVTFEPPRRAAQDTRRRAQEGGPNESIEELQQLMSSPPRRSEQGTRRQSRRARSDEVVEELKPSAPSPPLGAKPISSPPLTVISESPASHFKMHFGKLEDFNWYWESYPPTIAQKTQANHFFTSHGKSAKLLRSVAQFRLFPESDVPEVAFVGRSNVGKSSLLNAVVNADIKSLLARTSATPGFTKTMNLYGMSPGNGVTLKKEPNGRDKIVGLGGLTIVDMPGYGEGSLSSWGTEILKYIRSRKQLRRVFVLIDAEHGIKDKDRSLLATLRLSGVSHQIILSKLDKLYIPAAKEVKRFDGKSFKRLSQKGTKEGLREMMSKLKPGIQPPVGGGALGEILGVSAETLVDGRRLGIDHVRYAVLKAAGLDGNFKKEVSTPWAHDTDRTLFVSKIRSTK